MRKARDKKEKGATKTGLTPADPQRVNHGSEPGDSFGAEWTNKTYSTPDPHPGRNQPVGPAKHHEPTPFLR